MQNEILEAIKKGIILNKEKIKKDEEEKEKLRIVNDQKALQRKNYIKIRADKYINLIPKYITLSIRDGNKSFNLYCLSEYSSPEEEEIGNLIKEELKKLELKYEINYETKWTCYEQVDIIRYISVFVPEFES